MAKRRKPRRADGCAPIEQAQAILVHGTFASSEEDSGDAWWQSGSPVAQKLQTLVPFFVKVADKGNVFHWSGENSDRARSKAAAKLLRKLQTLEEEGQDYHLVGHSHGGSVIWNALQMSVLLKRPLKHLQSWTTIGTPFMQHRSRGKMNVMNIAGLLLGLLLLWPAFAAPRQLVTELTHIATDTRKPLTLKPDDQVGYTHIVRAPVLATVEWMGVDVERGPDGVVVGGFDPKGDTTLARYYLATPEGLFLLVLLAGISYLFIHASVYCISPAIESFRIRIENRLRRKTFETYGERWLGIWSPEDEAINGLRATLDMSVSFLSKMAPSEVVYLSDIIGLLSRPYYWVFAPIYNRLIHPALDSKIRNIVVRAAQGSDRPTATLVDVMPYPVELEEVTPQAIPSLLNIKLLSYANKNAHGLVPKLRNLIATPSFTSSLEQFGKQLTGKELVHTAYFDLEEILKLIAANMAWQSEALETSSNLRAMPPWLNKWFVGFKQSLSDASPVDVNTIPAERIYRKAS